jgi:hypothetical protein
MNVSLYTLRPLRNLQMAEKLNAINIDMEEEETKMEIMQHNRMMEDKREIEAMMKLKKEAKESCLSATTKHLLAFVMDIPMPSSTSGLRTYTQRMHTMARCWRGWERPSTITSLSRNPTSWTQIV